MEMGKDDDVSWKWIGAILVILGCGGFGFSLAAAQRYEERTLRNLIRGLDFMACELQYRMTPLPEVCAMAAKENHGCVSRVLELLAREMEAQVSPDADRCMQAALSAVGDIPRHTRAAFSVLGQSLGRFDLDGQLKSLEGVRSDCRRKLKELTTDKELRQRSYQTLGLCTGAALAILLI